MAAEICLRLYEELNDYLPPAKRKREFTCPIQAGTTVRQVLQAMGIPDPEVELVLVNGLSVDLSRVVAPGDRVSIYPVFESLDVRPLLRIREKPLRQTRFIAEPGLGHLASSLRSLGFDVIVDFPVRISKNSRRILLTTDPAHLRSGLSRVHLVRERNPEQQLNEVLSRLDLIDTTNSGSAPPAKSRQ